MFNDHYTSMSHYQRSDQYEDREFFFRAFIQNIIKEGFFGYMRLYLEGYRQKNKIIYKEIGLELRPASRKWWSDADEPLDVTLKK